MPSSEDVDHGFGHPGFVGSAHPLANRERPSRVRGIGRFRVHVVYLDGVERAPVSKWDYLGDALADRDREIESHAADGYDKSRCTVFVVDDEDPERRPDWDDLEEE